MNSTVANPVEALKAAVGFEPSGDAAGNLTLGAGALDGAKVRVALIENRIASGSIGKLEAAGLSSVLAEAAAERGGLVLGLDSAGARVSEGLDALGAFRRLFSDAILARAGGARIAAVLGRNCFGGASMLAHVAQRRLLAAETRMAMSGPAILAQMAGGSALDPMFVAMADASIGAAARAKACADNTVWSPMVDVAAWLRDAVSAPAVTAWESFRRRHDDLRQRLATPPAMGTPERIHRRDLAKLFGDVAELSEADGVIAGTVNGGAPILGLLGKSTVGATRAWCFSEHAWRLAAGEWPRIEVVLDCESHAARFDDERSVLTEYIVDMSVALAAARHRGAHVQLTILGKAGGGVYVALAGAATRIAAATGADIQVLPGAAVASILGSGHHSPGDSTHYQRAGVADDELKLGLPPGTPP